MRKFKVNVNGNSYEVEVEELDGAFVSSSVPTVKQETVQAVRPAVNVVGGNTIKSPMPGMILKLLLANGANVKKGDKILILEAMKMENDIVASADGVITYIVKQGDTIATGAILATIK